jgi:hypothetical protein
LQRIKDLLGDQNTKAASDPLKTIGIVGSSAATVGRTLLGLLKWRDGRKIESVQQLRDPDGRAGDVIIKIVGDGHTIAKEKASAEIKKYKDRIRHDREIAGEQTLLKIGEKIKKRSPRKK